MLELQQPQSSQTRVPKPPNAPLVGVRRNVLHICLTWDYSSILFTNLELVKSHKHFYQPTHSKLFNLIYRAHPDRSTVQTRTLLEEISKTCQTYQHFTPHYLGDTSTSSSSNGKSRGRKVNKRWMRSVTW